MHSIKALFYFLTLNFITGNILRKTRKIKTLNTNNNANIRRTNIGFKIPTQKQLHPNTQTIMQTFNQSPGRSDYILYFSLIQKKHSIFLQCLFWTP